MSIYAVMGSPVSHSLSPAIHRAFAAQFGQPQLQYEAIDVPAGGLAAALESFCARGGVGANITAPLKREAFGLCTLLSPTAERAGAVNTLSAMPDGGWQGDLTDGEGLIRALTGTLGQDLRDRRTLVLGAGGAAHAVVPALLEAGVGSLYLVNRSQANADALADRIGEPARVHTRRIEQLGEVGAFDLIINTATESPVTAFGLKGELIASPRTLVVDLNYGERAWALRAWAAVHDVQVFVDGLPMLIEQAALSYALWNNGAMPDTAPVYASFADKY